LRAPPTLCHPERTQISCFTATLATTYVVLPKENHMQSTEAATLDRKSGAAEGSAVRLSVFPNSSCQPPTPKPRCHPAPAVPIPRKPSPLRAPPTLCHPERSRGICVAALGFPEFLVSTPNPETEVSSRTCCFHPPQTISTESATHPFVIPSGPRFPASPLLWRPLMWFSLKRTTCNRPKPQLSTGNLG